MAETGDELIQVAWKLAPPWQDADLGWEEFGDNYRIDLKMTYQDSDGAELDETVCLTHWKDTSHASTSLEALPPPAWVPLARPDLGGPIPSVLKEKQRFVKLEMPMGYPVRVQAIVYFDVRDSKLPDHVHPEDFLKHPPGLESLAFYYKYKERDLSGGQGKRSHGEFNSLAELIELSGDIARVSTPAGYSVDGVPYEDVVYLDLPFSGRISGKWEEKMTVTYTGPGLKMLEVTAPDAAAAFDDQTKKEE